MELEGKMESLSYVAPGTQNVRTVKLISYEILTYRKLIILDFS